MDTFLESNVFVNWYDVLFGLVNTVVGLDLFVLSMFILLIVLWAFWVDKAIYELGFELFVKLLGLLLLFMLFVLFNKFELDLTTLLFKLLLWSLLFVEPISILNVLLIIVSWDMRPLVEIGFELTIFSISLSLRMLLIVVLLEFVADALILLVGLFIIKNSVLIEFVADALTLLVGLLGLGKNAVLIRFVADALILLIGLLGLGELYIILNGFALTIFVFN